MEYISSLLASLDNSELRKLKKYIKNNYAGQSKQKKQTDLFFKMLFEGKSEEKIVAKLYGKSEKPPKAYFILKGRIRKIIEEFLLLSTFQQEDLEKTHPVLFLRSNALLADILDNRGLKPLTYKRHWLTNLKVARKTRYVRFEFEAALKRFIAAPEPSRMALEEIERMGREYLFGVKMYLHFHMFVPSYLLTEKKKEALLKEIKRFLESVAEDVKKVKNKTPWEYYHSLQLWYYKFARKEKELKELLTFLYEKIIEDRDYPLHRDTLSLLWNMYLAFLSYRDFFKGRELLKRILKIIPLFNINYLILRRNLMMLDFYSGDIKKALEAGEELISNESLKKFGRHYERVIYFLSNIYFVNKNYQKSGILLMELKDLLKDKEGWNITTRFLELMLIVENNDLDMFEIRLDALRKFIRHHNIKEKYDLAFYEYLRALQKSSLNFHKVENSEELLKNIEKHWDDDLPSEDVIPYHFWIRSKIENRDIYPMILSYYRK